MMDTACRVFRMVSSELDRFEAALAINGLCHPPEFAGGAWYTSDKLAFHRGAIGLAAISGGYPIDACAWQRMEDALRTVRTLLLLRDADCWPDLPARRNDEARTIDFSLLIGWGAASWYQRLEPCVDRVSVRARAASLAVVTAVGVAMSAASAGRHPARDNPELRRRLMVLRTALHDRQQPRATARRRHYGKAWAARPLGSPATTQAMPRAAVGR